MNEAQPTRNEPLEYCGNPLGHSQNLEVYCLRRIGHDGECSPNYDPDLLIEAKPEAPAPPCPHLHVDVVRRCHDCNYILMDVEAAVSQPSRPVEEPILPCTGDEDCEHECPISEEGLATLRDELEHVKQNRDSWIVDRDNWIARREAEYKRAEAAETARDAAIQELGKVSRQLGAAEARESRTREALEKFVAAREPNGYPLWFNHAVNECEKCDSEDLCNAHWDMANRDFTGCEAEITEFARKVIEGE